MKNNNIFIHERGICESEHVGKGTRIWAYAHILPKAKIGKDCNICDHVFIENDVCLGDRVTVKCGVQLWDGMVIEDDVFIGPNATFTNDPFPRSKKHQDQIATTRVCSGASIGANATVLPGLTIGRNAMVGAGTVVTRSVPPNAVVMGNPARITGYTDTDQQGVCANDLLDIAPQEDAEFIPTKVKGVSLHKLPLVADIRGSLSVGEFGEHIPFNVSRYFFTFDVPSEETRGAHAHRQCHQFLICVHGSLSVVVDDGQNREEVLLNKINLGLYLPPMIWGVQYKYSPDAILLVLASHHYDPDDYIRDYDSFLDAL